MVSYYIYLIYFDRDDKLAYIYSADQIIEYYNKYGNINNETQYNDRKYALEFLEICYNLENIDLESQEFINLSWIWGLKDYMNIHDISEPRDCIKWENIWNSELLPSCIFNNEENLHAPYLAAYLNRTITVARFSNAMSALSEYYKNKYPTNAYLLETIWDKSKWIIINKQYCNDIIRSNISNFIRPIDNK